MKIHLLLLCFFLGYACQTTTDKKKEPVAEQFTPTVPQFSQDSIKAIFANLKLTGTFVVKSLATQETTIYNEARASTPFLPASTFKIPNSLIALENQAVKDEKEVIPWDGERRIVAQWNQDQDLRSALKYSCVWFYQELARRVGEDRMRNHLKAMNYGNGDLSAGIDRFWLTGNFQISAMKQIAFLEKFYQQDFPFTPRNYDIVKNALRVEQGTDYSLHAKTGWSGSSLDPQIAWYVGYLKHQEQVYLFALNFVPTKNEDLKARQLITRRVFELAGLM
ncbi:MAG: class D beta-lactamase [Saprospiraceae bacterium]